MPCHIATSIKKFCEHKINLDDFCASTYVDTQIAMHGVSQILFLMSYDYHFYLELL